MLRHYVSWLSVFLLSLSMELSAAPSYLSPKQICSIYGEKINGKDLQSINDVSLLNETKIACLIAPKSVDEISNIVASINEWNKTNAPLHISVAGTKHSQGGHTASPQGITLDMRHLKKVDSPVNKNGLWSIKAQAGALWSDLHNVIRQFQGHSLANKVQQSSTPFSIGGTLSVNAHGRSFSYGSVINSVERITVVLPNGSITEASRVDNSALFKQVIGGYGLFGVIVDVTLELQTNNYLKPYATSFETPEEYIALLKNTLKDTPRHQLQRDKSGVLTNVQNSPIAYLFATLSLDKEGFLSSGIAYRFNQLSEIDKSGFINPDPKPSLLKPKALITKLGFILKRKGHLIKTAQRAQYRFLMTQDSHLKVLTPPIQPILAASSSEKPDLLQEYFIPVAQVPEFLNHIKNVFSKNGIILSNASLRFIPKSKSSSLLTYESRTDDQLAIVLYFSLELKKHNIAKAQTWTQDLVNKATSLNGRYYLPYQQWPTREQFQRAYPNYQSFLEQKTQQDPHEVFSNQFYQYYIK